MRLVGMEERGRESLRTRENGRTDENLRKTQTLNQHEKAWSEVWNGLPRHVDDLIPYHSHFRAP